MQSKHADNFVLKDEYGNDFELYKNLDKNILLIFYPKDNSLVCSKQLRNYQENINQFLKHNIQPVAINIESAESHKTFCNLKSLKFPLLSDTNKIVSNSFNALNIFSINKRKLVLINQQKNIIYERNMFSLNFINTMKIIEELQAKNLI